MSDFLDEDASPDFWYDVASEDARKILLNFTESDWDDLLKNIETQPIELKRKLVYCLGDGDDGNQLRVIMELISTDDNELFTMCIDSLRFFRTDQIHSRNPELVKMIENKIQNAGAASRRTMNDFLKNS